MNNALVVHGEWIKRVDGTICSWNKGKTYYIDGIKYHSGAEMQDDD